MQVFLRLPEGLELVHEQETYPTLRTVALDILPAAVAAARSRRLAQRQKSDGR